MSLVLLQVHDKRRHTHRRFNPGAKRDQCGSACSSGLDQSADAVGLSRENA